MIDTDPDYEQIKYARDEPGTRAYIGALQWDAAVFGYPNDPAAYGIK